jgi:hypothetical protein
MLVTMHGYRDALHVRATGLPVVVGHGCSPLKAVLVPLVAILNSLLGAVGGNVGGMFLSPLGWPPCFPGQGEA